MTDVQSVYQRGLDSPSAGPHQRGFQRVAVIGEPFMSGFNPSSLAANLAACGLELIEDLNGRDLTRRFDGGGEHGLAHSAFSRIALARVGAEHACG